MVQLLKVPQIRMNNGRMMPSFGLGTYKSFNEVGNAIRHAIDVGYRHFDTASSYLNEAEVGQAIQDKIREGIVQREEIFIVTKLWNTCHDPDKVESTCRKSLELLGLNYIDLYLIHFPMGHNKSKSGRIWPLQQCDANDIDYLDTWKEMEKLVELDLVKSIGVSNFNSEQIERLCNNCTIRPVNNQIEVHPANNSKKLINFCLKRDIVVTAYSPLCRPNPELKQPKFLYDSKINKLAEKYNKTSAQIVLRYLLHIGAVPIPKTITYSRIEENIKIFDFQLSKEDIELIDSYNTGERIIKLEECRMHKYFPFGIEY